MECTINTVKELHLDADRTSGQGQEGLEEFFQWSMVQNGVERL